MSKLKVGLIVECTQAGLERLVCPKILELLGAETRMQIESRIHTMTNKKLLIRDAATTAAILLSEGFDRIVVLWDENPAWTPEEDFAREWCWHNEREQLLANITTANLDRKRIAMVCIEREFETWLFHDHQLLRDVVSTAKHKAKKIKRFSNPLQIHDPKGALLTLFSKHKGRYNPAIAGQRFAKCLNSLDHLKRCDTFRYFAQGVLGRMPAGWTPYTYKPKGPKAK